MRCAKQLVADLKEFEQKTGISHTPRIMVQAALPGIVEEAGRGLAMTPEDRAAIGARDAHGVNTGDAYPAYEDRHVLLDTLRDLTANRDSWREECEQARDLAVAQNARAVAAEAENARLREALEDTALRRQLDGSPCWCWSHEAPHEGWVHSPHCERMRDALKPYGLASVAHDLRAAGRAFIALPPAEPEAER